MAKKESMTKTQKKGLVIMFLGLAITLVLSGLGEKFIGEAKLTEKNIISLFSTIGIIIAIYAIGRFILPKGPVNMNLKDDNLGLNYAKGLVIGLIMMLAYVALAWILGGINFQGLGKISPLAFILYLLGFAIQGFSEELLVRGLLQEYIAKKNRLLSILAPSIIFSLLHLGNSNFSLVAMINTALIGVLYALMTDLSGSLWMAAGAHSIWNFLLGPFFGFYVSGIPMDKSFLAFAPVEGKVGLNGGLYGPEGAIFVAVIIIISIMPFLISFIKSKKSH